MAFQILVIAAIVSLASATFPPGVDPRKCPNYPYCTGGNPLLPRPPKRVQYVQQPHQIQGHLSNHVLSQQHRPAQQQLVRYVSPDGTPLGPPVPAGSPAPKLVRYVTPDGRPLGGVQLQNAPKPQVQYQAPRQQVQYQPQPQVQYRPQPQVQRRVQYVPQQPQQFGGQRQVVRYI